MSYARDPNSAERGSARRNKPKEKHPFKTNANIWSYYLEGAQEDAEHRAKRWETNLDSLLTFAGLFAGVVASFLVDSRHDLQADPQVVLLANIHSALLNEPSLPPESFVLRTSTLWINGLWFVSLLVTLFSATTAVVAKGWISNFRTVSERRKNSTTAFERWLLDTMADRWYLEYFVAFVPLALQVGLLLFSLGFALQVLNDNKTLGWTVLVMVLFGVFCYITMTIINILAPRCPLQTPLSTLLLDLKDSLWPESQNGMTQRQIVHLGEGSRVKMVSSHTEKDMARIIQENLLQSSNAKHVDEALAELGRTPLSHSLFDYFIRAKTPRILLDRLRNRVALRMYDDQALLASHLQTLLAFIRYFNLRPSSTALKKIFSELLSSNNPLDRWDAFPEPLRALAFSARSRLLIICGQNIPDEEMKEHPWIRIIDKMDGKHRREFIMAACMTLEKGEGNLQKFGRHAVTLSMAKAIVHPLSEIKWETPNDKELIHKHSTDLSTKLFDQTCKEWEDSVKEAHWQTNLPDMPTFTFVHALEDFDVEVRIGAMEGVVKIAKDLSGINFSLATKLLGEALPKLAWLAIYDKFPFSRDVGMRAIQKLLKPEDDSNMSSPEVKLIVWGAILDALENSGVASDPSPIVGKLNVTMEDALDTICTSLGDLGFPLEAEDLVEPFNIIAPCFNNSHEDSWPLHAIRCALLIKLAPASCDSVSKGKHLNLLIAILQEVVIVYRKSRQMNIMSCATVVFHELVKRSGFTEVGIALLSLTISIPYLALRDLLLDFQHDDLSKNVLNVSKVEEAIGSLLKENQWVWGISEIWAIMLGSAIIPDIQIAVNTLFILMTTHYYMEARNAALQSLIRLAEHLQVIDENENSVRITYGDGQYAMVTYQHSDSVKVYLSSNPKELVSTLEIRQLSAKLLGFLVEPNNIRIAVRKLLNIIVADDVLIIREEAKDSLIMLVKKNSSIQEIVMEQIARWQGDHSTGKVLSKSKELDISQEMDHLKIKLLGLSTQNNIIQTVNTLLDIAMTNETDDICNEAIASLWTLATEHSSVLNIFKGRITECKENSVKIKVSLQSEKVVEAPLKVRQLWVKLLRLDQLVENDMVNTIKMLFDIAITDEEVCNEAIESLSTLSFEANQNSTVLNVFKERITELQAGSIKIRVSSQPEKLVEAPWKVRQLWAQLLASAVTDDISIIIENLLNIIKKDINKDVRISALYSLQVLAKSYHIDLKSTQDKDQNIVNYMLSLVSQEQLQLLLQATVQHESIIVRTTVMDLLSKKDSWPDILNTYFEQNSNMQIIQLQEINDSQAEIKDIYEISILLLQSTKPENLPKNVESIVNTMIPLLVTIEKLHPSCQAILSLLGKKYHITHKLLDFFWQKWEGNSQMKNNKKYIYKSIIKLLTLLSYLPAMSDGEEQPDSIMFMKNILEKLIMCLLKESQENDEETKSLCTEVLIKLANKNIHTISLAVSSLFFRIIAFVRDGNVDSSTTNDIAMKLVTLASFNWENINSVSEQLRSLLKDNLAPTRLAIAFKLLTTFCSVLSSMDYDALRPMLYNVYYELLNPIIPDACRLAFKSEDLQVRTNVLDFLIKIYQFGNLVLQQTCETELQRDMTKLMKLLEDHDYGIRVAELLSFISLDFNNRKIIVNKIISSLSSKDEQINQHIYYLLSKLILNNRLTPNASPTDYVAVLLASDPVIQTKLPEGIAIYLWCNYHELKSPPSSLSDLSKRSEQIVNLFTYTLFGRHVTKREVEDWKVVKKD